MTATTATNTVAGTTAIVTVSTIYGDVQAHKPGCADLKRRKNLDKDTIFPMDVTSQRDAFLQFNEDFIAEGGEENGHPITFLPCIAKEVPELDEAEEATEEVAEEATMSTAVSRATKLVSEGKAAKVKEALAQVGVSRVSEVPKDQLGEFVAALG